MTPRRLAPFALVLALALALAACGGDGKGKGTKVTTETTAGPGVTVGTAPVSIKARLTGTEEFPGPGVKEGVGAFLLEVRPTQGCYDLKVTMGEKPQKAHVHRGATGAAGPVVVDLAPQFASGESVVTAKACVDLRADVAAALVADPAGYYVNVHSDAHPDGALRGQLARF